MHHTHSGHSKSFEFSKNHYIGLRVLFNLQGFANSGLNKYLRLSIRDTLILSIIWLTFLSDLRFNDFRVTSMDIINLEWQA